MQNSVYYRIAGHVACLYLQISYMSEAVRKFEQHLPTHPEINRFYIMLPRFLTMWNLFYQVLYASIALPCDVTTALNMESVIPKCIRHHRHTLRSGLVFPLMAAVTSFWPIFLFDRELILPKSLDVAISPTCNFMWHGFIMIYALWELILMPKDTPKPPGPGLIIMNNCIYIAQIFYTRYLDLGIWPYDVLTVTEGTIYFFLVVGGIFTSTVFAYFLQFRLKDYITGEQLCDKKKIL